MLLADFHDADEAARWRPTDDVVMGGVSSSAMLAGDGAGIFCGELSLDRGGGFASVRRRTEVVDLSACDAVELRVRGDGKRYKLNLRVSDSPDGVVYQAAFETQAGTWTTAKLPFAGFVPRCRGRPASGTLDSAHVSSLGLLISDLAGRSVPARRVVDRRDVEPQVASAGRRLFEGRRWAMSSHVLPRRRCAMSRMRATRPVSPLTRRGRVR